MNVGVQAGRLISEVTIEQLTGKAQSANGETTPVWTPSTFAYAEIKPLRGDNLDEAMARTRGKVVSHQISLRHPGFDLNPVKYRITFEGRVFEIASVLDVYERHIALDILANEVIA